MGSFVFKAVTGVFTFLYMFLALSTCSPKIEQAQEAVLSPTEEIPLGQSGDVVTISILQSQEISLELQEAIELYTRTNSGIKINVQTISSYSEYRTVLRSKFINGEKVDIFHIFGSRDMQDIMPKIEPLSEMQWVYGAIDNSLDSVKQEGKVFGIPYAIDATGLIVNKDIFDAADISLSTINTFEDLEEAFSQLRQKIISGELLKDFPNLEVVSEVAGQNTEYLGEKIADLVLSETFNTPLEVSSAKVLGASNLESSEKYLRLMSRFTTSRADLSKLTKVSETMQIENGLATGRVAAILQNVSVFNRIYKVDPKMTGRLSLLPIMLEGEANSYIYTGVPAYWAVNADSGEAQKVAAKDFLTWLYCSDAGTTLLSNRFMIVSPYQDTAKEVQVSLQNQMLSYIKRGRALPWLHNETPDRWGKDVFAKGVQEYLSGEKDWQVMIKEVEQGW